MAVNITTCLRTLTFAAWLAGAQAVAVGTAEEYQIKAAFLYHLITDVAWPADVFRDAHTPHNICVLGDDPFGIALELIIREAGTRNSRAVALHHIAKVEESLVPPCHILFISTSEYARMSEILAFTVQYPILTVGENRDFSELGGAVQFYLEKNKVRLMFNATIIARVGLNISDELMRPAWVKHTPEWQYPPVQPFPDSPIADKAPPAPRSPFYSSSPTFAAKPPFAKDGRPPATHSSTPRLPFYSTDRAPEPESATRMGEPTPLAQTQQAKKEDSAYAWPETPPGWKNGLPWKIPPASDTPASTAAKSPSEPNLFGTILNILKFFGTALSLLLLMTVAVGVICLRNSFWRR